MSSRKFNRIVAVSIALAVALTVLLMAVPELLGEVEAVTMPYEEKVFRTGDVIEIEITVDEAQWQNLLNNATSEEYISCDITVNGYTVKTNGIRAKGNSSLSSVFSSSSDRYSFKVEFDHYVSGQTLYGLDKLALNNNYADSTYMKEYLSYMLFESVGVASPLCTFAHITVNGEEWGLYLAVECFEESFAQRNYGTSYGNLYKPESSMGMDMGGMQNVGGNNPIEQFEGNGDFDPSQFGGGQRPDFNQGQQGGMPDGNAGNEGSFTMPDGENFAIPDGAEMPEGFDVAEIIDFNGGGGMGGSGTDLAYTDDEYSSYSGILDNLVLGSSSNAAKKHVIKALEALDAGENVEDYIDVEAVLKYFAVNTVVVNLDHYVGTMLHNYYLYEDDGVLTMLPWDYNLSFAGFSTSDASNAVNFPIDTPVQGTTLEDRPMLGKLLENEEYLALYHSYLQEIVDSYFSNRMLVEAVDLIAEMIGDYVKNDATAFYTYEEFTAGVDALKTYINLRGQSLEGQLDGSIPTTSEEQSATPSALIDASSLNLSALGSQGGGVMASGNFRGNRGGIGNNAWGGNTTEGGDATTTLPPNREESWEEGGATDEGDASTD